MLEILKTRCEMQHLDNTYMCIFSRACWFGYAGVPGHANFYPQFYVSRVGNQ